MLHSFKSYLLGHEPFRQAHMGLWIRTLYFRHYLFRLLSKSPETILDAGCGRGTYARMLAERFPKARVEGIDILAVPEWQSAPANLHFSPGDLTTLSEKDVYDLIVSIDVLEHITGNEIVIKNFYQALKPGGVLYLAVPCEHNEIHIFPHKWFSKFHEWEEHEHIGEQRNLRDMKELLNSLGFEILFSRYTFTFFGTLAWEMETLLSYGGRFKNALRILLMPLFKLLGILDIYVPFGKGNNLTIAKKA